MSTPIELQENNRGSATTDPQGNDRTAYTSAFPTKRDPRVDKVDTEQGSTKSAAGSGVNVGDIERLISAGLGVGMLACALMEKKSSSWISAIAGGSLLFRGLTGQCHLYRALGMNTAKGDGAVVPAQAGFKVEAKIKVARSREELYRFWRDVSNLPRIMDHLKEVKEIGGNRSRWIAETAVGEIHWEAEIFNERANEMIAWRSLPGSLIDTAGSVRFNELLPSGHTEVIVSLKYNPPLGALGAQIESWLGGSLQKRITEDLRRFKETMESGHAARQPQIAGMSRRG